MMQIPLQDQGFDRRVMVEMIAIETAQPTSPMNAYPISRTLACFVISLLMLTVAASTARSQTAATNHDEASQTASPYTLEITDGECVHDGKKTEATLENIVELLRDRHKEANIIVAPDVPPLKIGSLKLRATDLRMELEALKVASGERFKVSGGGSRESPLYVLEPASQAKQHQLRVEAFNLGPYLAILPTPDSKEERLRLIDKKVEEINRMVQETIDRYEAIQEHLDGKGASPQVGVVMRFHPGANLLILIGEPEEIEIASKVIEALPLVQRSDSQAATSGRPPMLDPSTGVPYGTSR